MSENKMTGAEQQREEITVKFGKGLVGEPFMAKTGKECVSISVPNADPNDKSPWAKFIVPADQVRNNLFGKGVWMKLPADGEMKLYRSQVTGYAPDGRKAYSNTVEMVPNTQIKAMMESYKTRTAEQSKAAPTVPPAKKSYDMGR